MPAPLLPMLDDPQAPCRVKVCGFRDGANLHEVAALGPDAVGWNFWPGSKRYVQPLVAAGWVADLPPGILRIGVFVNPTDDEVLGLWRDGVIQLAQLHGDEPPEQCARLLEAGLPVIKAVGFRKPADLDRAAAGGVRHVLADAYAPGVHGGTGRTIDWVALRTALDARPGLRLVLSGGLRPDNVAEAVARVRPAMVDVAGGVESSPGLKALEKVAAFLEAVRAVSRLRSGWP